MYLISPPITNKPPINALTNPQSNGAVKSAAVSLVHSKRAAPAIIGVESKKEILYHIDGEPRKTDHRLEIKVARHAMRLLIP